MNLGRLERHQLGERETEEPIETGQDHSLADRARNGDLDAFEEVDARSDRCHLPALVRHHRGRGRRARLDEETFIAAWRRIRELHDPGRFDAWLQRIAVNAARMTLRARGRRRVRGDPIG